MLCHFIQNKIFTAFFNFFVELIIKLVIKQKYILPIIVITEE